MVSKTKNDAGVYLASRTTRLIALFIDSLILGAIGGALFGVGREVGGGVGLLIGAAYNWYFWTRHNGQTLGKMVMGIRVIRRNGQPLSDTDALIRYFGYYLNSILFGIGWLWAFIDREKQGFHDKLADTVVVEA